MTFRDYLKDRKVFLGINILFFISVVIIFWILNISSAYVGILFIVWFTPLSTYIFVEYIKFKTYINRLLETSEQLENKYLLAEVIEAPRFLEGQLLHECMKSSYQSMLEEVKKEKIIQKEYKEYIETWVHEIKTPIASIGLVTKNQDNESGRKIAYEVRRIENYVEQVLYYAKSSEVKTDYLIKSFNLREMVLEVVKQYRTDFIRKKIGIELGELEQIVYSDCKWVAFIFSQLISNAIKYSKDKQSKIRIDTKIRKNQVILSIEDTGVGISEKDIRRVFDKGFTGENGRRYGKSTGIGLYLCKQLCEKLGLGIQLSSKMDVGTTVEVIFPVGNQIEYL